MPIYMDRHHMKGATARAVADAHSKDLALQSKFGINLLTYWFDENRGSAFCLMEAPNEASVTQLHAEAHGAIPNKIIRVDPDLVATFLGRIADPYQTGDFDDENAIADSAFRTIMFSDMKDSTAMTTRLGEVRALALFRIHNSISRNAIQRHHGREIQHTGDGFFVSFRAATDALNCAIDMQKAFAAHNENNPEGGIEVRIGLSAGEPIEEDRRLFGSTVQLSARLCEWAAPRQILVSPVVRDLCGGEQFVFADRGEALLKGFDQPVRIYELEFEWGGGPT